MGKIIRREVIAIGCELRSCTVQVPVGPYPTNADWYDMLTPLTKLVATGWGIVLNEKLRAYCPTHAGLVDRCSCKTRPEMRPYCTQHSEEAAGNVWDQTRIPQRVSGELAPKTNTHLMIGTAS